MRPGENQGPGANRSPEVSPSTTTGPSYNGPPTKRGRDREAVEEVADYREVARRLLRDEALSWPDRQTALLRLVRRARASASWPEAAIRAVEAEVALDLDRLEALPAADRYIRAQRTLRGEGYARCPRCHTEVATEADFRAWEAADRARLAELQAREGAVR